MMTLNDVELLLRENDIFTKFGVSRLAIFGSFARGESYRDIDFLLETDMDYITREKLKKTLKRILKTDVDLVSAKFADPIILYRAKKEMKYVNDSSKQ